MTSGQKGWVNLREVPIRECVKLEFVIRCRSFPKN